MWFSYKSLGLLGIVGFAVTVGCTATTGTGLDNTGGNGGDGNGGWGQGNGTAQGGKGGEGGGIIFPTGVGGGGGSGPIDDCSDAARLVYVLSTGNELYSFDPPSKKFTFIGNLGCNTNLLPNSMAVDRNAVAWVNYVNSGDNAGVIFKVNTSDASCEATPTVQLASGWRRMGMGFSSDGPGSKSETLFVAGKGTTGLGKINASNTLNPIADFVPGTFTGKSAELTGTGDGRLYGYFTTDPVQVGLIDKTTGAVTNGKVITGLATPTAFAFSFWGGSFYLYAATGNTSDSNVTKYDPVAGTIDNVYMTNIGFRIVGAGVSTCAPVVEPPPK